MSDASLGTPIPNTIHAVSVSLPRWRDVVGYEEGDRRVIHALKAGYPRFVYHPVTRRLFDQCKAQFAGPGEDCLVLPSLRVAERCQAYLQRQGIASAVHDLLWEGLRAVTFPENAASHAKAFWQHTGLIVSSRQAEACLQRWKPDSSTSAKSIMTKRIAGLADCASDDIWLHSCGMAAIHAAHEAISARLPDAKTVQLGFPYLDTLKIQQKWGAGAYFLNYARAEDLSTLSAILQKEKIAAVFCEFPTNPLLASIDLKALSTLLRRHHVPLVIDDTVGSWANVRVLPYADMLTTSLTKFFSGVGDVLGGSLILRRDSLFYAELKTKITATYEDLFFNDDARVLEENSRDFLQRMRVINANAARLAERLRGHPAIAQVYSPLFVNRDVYDAYRLPEGGYGGLFSLMLTKQEAAPRFYDALAVAKGPSLGTNYTLACPYTLLAHYHELEWAESCGVSRWLVRVSVGMEPYENIEKVFLDALAQI